jgi:hypothetical protein
VLQPAFVAVTTETLEGMATPWTLAGGGVTGLDGVPLPLLPPPQAVRSRAIVASAKPRPAILDRLMEILPSDIAEGGYACARREPEPCGTVMRGPAADCRPASHIGALPRQLKPRRWRRGRGSANYLIIAKMEFEPTRLSEVVLIRPRAFKDERGYFMETWREQKFAAAGIQARFVQDNQSHSVRHTLRGDAESYACGC